MEGVLPQQTGTESGGGPGDMRGQAAARHAETRQGIYLAVHGRNNMYLQLHYIYGSVFDAFCVLLPRNVTYISSNIKILNLKQIFKCSSKYNFEKRQFPS